jgi:hypothetical protein
MPTEEVTAMFQTHDAYVKALNWLPLSPLLSNLDKPRLEHHPDGSTVERTTREWARNIKTLDGKNFARCDVVNGGSDQLAYLLFPPSSGEAANSALEQYRKLINPFKHREARYSEKVGPATGNHFSSKVIANIDFLKKLSSDMSVQSTQSCPKSTADHSNGSKVSNSTTSTVSEVNPPPRISDVATNPPASERNHSDSDTVDTEMTDNTRSTSPSKPNSDRMSTTTARFREIDKLLNNQKQLAAKHEQMSSDRISQIERQLHRITDMEGKIDSVKQEFSTRLDDFEGKMLSSMKRQIDSSGGAFESMNTKLEKLMLVMSQVMTDNVNQDMTATASLRDSSTHASARLGSSTAQVHSIPVTSTGQHFSATSAINSPQKKRIRSTKERGKKRNLNEATRAALESLNDKSPTQSNVISSRDVSAENKNPDSHLTQLSGLTKRNLEATSFSKSPGTEQSSLPMDLSVTSTPLNSPPASPLLPSFHSDDELLTPRSSTPTSPMVQATDPESQYTDKSSSDDDNSQSDHGSSSLCRGAKH